jgi:hypothetical protein
MRFLESVQVSTATNVRTFEQKKDCMKQYRERQRQSVWVLEEGNPDLFGFFIVVLVAVGSNRPDYFGEEMMNGFALVA